MIQNARTVFSANSINIEKAVSTAGPAIINEGNSPDSNARRRI